MSEPGDAFELEADRAAEQVVSAAPGAESPATGHPRPQTARANAVFASAPAGVRDVATSPGQPLDEPTRAFMEHRFGQDFGSVRVHTDAAADASASAMDASAYTIGRHVAFAAGQYEPASSMGRKLLAHELAHVVQQDAAGGRGAPGSATPPIQRQHRARAAQVRGEETDTSVAALLESLRRRLPEGARAAPAGRVIGDELRLDDAQYRIVLQHAPTGASAREEGEGESTASAQLGVGAFFLNPIAREHMGVAALAPGGAYEILRIDTAGGLHETGFSVLTRDLEPQPTGLLVYTTSVIRMRDVHVEARAPQDTAAAAQRVIAYMDTGPPVWLNPGISAMFLTESETLLAPLSDEELMEVFHHLQDAGRLGELFNLVSAPAFRAFLHRKHVPWEFVFSNWESSLNDNLAVFAGVLVGAGENFYQVLELIGMMIGSIFSEELAQQRRQFWEALGQFFHHPIMTAEAGLAMLRDTFVEKLDQLEFFDAGRIIGNVAVVILTLPSAIRSIPQLARNLARLAITLARVTLAVVEELGVTLAEIGGFAVRPAEQLATGSGYILMMSGDDILALGGRGQQSVRIARAAVLRGLRGRALLADLTDAEIERALQSLDDAAAETRAAAPQAAPSEAAPPEAAGAAGAALTIENLEGVVQDAIRALREELGDEWVPSSEYGTRLHAVVARLIGERFPSAGDISILTEESIGAMGRVSPRVLAMTVEEFVNNTVGLREYADELRPLFNRVEGGRRVARLVRDLRPDLVVRTPEGLAVWDLTSQSNAQHLAKTILYARILGEEGEMVRIGETYWRHFTGSRPFVPRRLYPAAVEAAEAQRRRARARARRTRGSSGSGGSAD